MEVKTPNPHDTIARAGRAERELELTTEIFAGLRQAMLEQIASSGVEHVAKREKLFMGIQSLEAVRKMLMGCVSAGAVAEHALNYEVEMAKAGFTQP